MVLCHVNRFIALADVIEDAFPNLIVEGNPDGDGRAGAFEVSSEAGDVIFSKLQSRGFPDVDSVVAALQDAAAAGQGCEVQQ
eukprot:jgi/Chrzof1/1145/Cz01g42080.t1